MKTRAWIALVVLAGCVAEPTAEDEEAGPDWSSCRWTMPDGEPLPCDGTTTALGDSMPRDPLWVCNFRQDYAGGGYISFLRSPTGDEHAIAFDVGDVPASGTFAVRDSSGLHTYNWSKQPSGMIPLGRAFDATGELYIFLYRAWLETDDPRLANATLRQAVTWVDDEPFAIHHVNADAGKFVFYERRMLMFSESSFSTIGVQDSGYNSTFFVKGALGGSFDWAVLGAPNPNCINDTPTPLPAIA